MKPPPTAWPWGEEEVIGHRSSVIGENGAQAFLPESFFIGPPRPQGARASCPPHSSHPSHPAHRAVFRLEKFPCGNAAGSIDGDCLTPLYGGGGRSLDFRAAFASSYTARCIIRTIAARCVCERFDIRNMKVNTILGLCGISLLCHCTTNETTPDTLIPFEHAGHPPNSIRDGYRMIQLVVALPIWEIAPQDRGTYISEFCKQEPSEDLFAIEAIGAQQAFTILRLDKDLVTVISHANVIGDINSVRVLRRIPGAWQDLTSRAFPYAVDKNSRIRGNRDKSVVVREPHSGRERRFIWTESRYVEE